MDHIIHPPQPDDQDWLHNLTDSDKNDGPSLSLTVETLFEPGDIVELRMFKKIKGATRPVICSGFFTDFEKLIEAAEAYDADGYEINVTLNKLKPENFEGRRLNVVGPAKFGEGASDDDVARRRWLFIDADPKRPSGISSTDAEKAQARFRALEVQDFLEKQGWGRGIFCESGNGYHLLYPIDLPNDQVSLALVGGVLEALKAKFEDEAVEIDQTTKNASRIDKFYGVTAKKGENSPERPWRQSRILEVPEDLTPVSKQQLAKVAALETESPNGSGPKIDVGDGDPEKSRRWLEAWISRYEVPIGKHGPWRGEGYVWEIDEPCPNGHTDTSYWIGVKPEGPIVGGCHHNSCSDYDWRAIRDHYERKVRAEKAWSTCAELAARQDITRAFADTLHAKGVAGESNQIRLLYLIVNSRRLEKPVNAAVKGASSSGKSYLVEQVLEGFPDSAYYALSAMSEKALIYLDEDMKHRFLVIYEASGMAGDMQTYLIRTLLSEGKIRYQTAEATSKGVKPRLLEMEGPTGLIVTTTQTKMHPENETRLFSLLVTDSRDQTADILMAMADEDREPVSMDEWRALQTWLEGQPSAVYIHYAKELASLVPPVAVRLRRDFMAVLQLIRSHAVLHQHTRERDEKGRILASFEDYAVVRELVAPLVAEGVDATVPKTVRETVDMVKELTEDEPHVSLRELANALELDKGTTSRRWAHARDAGYLKNLEDKRGKPAKICLGDPLPEEIDVLPTLEALVECCSVAGASEGRYTPPERCTGAKGRNKAATFDTSSVENNDNYAEYSKNGSGADEGVYIPQNDGATLQHPKVVHYTRDPFDEYIGRGGGRTGQKRSKWHNPFVIDTDEERKDGTRDEVIEKFERYLKGPVENYEGKVYDGRHLKPDFPEIRGKILGCHCAPKGGLTEHDELYCHGQTLLRLANAPDDPDEGRPLSADLGPGESATLEELRAKRNGAVDEGVRI